MRSILKKWPFRNQDVQQPQSMDVDPKVDPYLHKFICIDNTSESEVLTVPLKLEIDTRDLYSEGSDEFQFFNGCNHTVISVTPEQIEERTTLIQNIFDILNTFTGLQNIKIHFKIVKSAQYEFKVFTSYLPKQVSPETNGRFFMNLVSNFVMDTIQRDKSLCCFLYYKTLNEQNVYFQFDYRHTSDTRPINSDTIHTDRSEYVMLCFDKRSDSMESFTTDYAISNPTVFRESDNLQVTPLYQPMIERIGRIFQLDQINKPVLHKFKIRHSFYHTICFNDPIMNHRAPKVNYARSYFRIKINYITGTEASDRHSEFIFNSERSIKLSEPFIYNNINCRDMFTLIKVLSIDPLNQIDDSGTPVPGSLIAYNKELIDGKCVTFSSGVKISAYGGLKRKRRTMVKNEKTKKTKKRTKRTKRTKSRYHRRK